jgi:ABC-type transport system substrate-binding protein
MSPIRLTRNPLAVIAVLGAALALGGASAASATTHAALAAPSAGSAATLPTPTRIVLFNGGSATPFGPAVQPAGQWTVSTDPVKITTTNYGTLVEDTSLGPIGACAAHCGEWWYDPRPSWVQLAEFYWDKTNGTQVLATNLVPALANNGEWAYLGDGTYTPLCLSWLVTASNNTYTLYYIKLSLTTHKWSEISLAELSTC